MALFGVGLVAVIWSSTALLQAPRHTAFAEGFDRRQHRRLIATNWIRTAAWTARGLLELAMVWHVIR